jgi:hypothetical protein
MMPALERLLNYTDGRMGKIYIITGFRNSRGPFVSKI